MELLGEIFQRVVLASAVYPAELDLRHGNPYDITLVSRHWRDVAYSTPQLWMVLPGHYPELWEAILERSGSLPLRVEWYKKAPKRPQTWRPEILHDPSCYGRLQVLKLRPRTYSRELKRRAQQVAQHSSLSHIHLEGGATANVWGEYAEFLTFVQSLPHMSDLGLEGGCIPLMDSNHVATPRTRFVHPNLRKLYLKGWAWRVLEFLESVPLQALERLELEVKCIGDVSKVRHLDPQEDFRDFWGGRRELPRSIEVFISKSTLQITLGRCQTPGHGQGHESDANAPLLKLVTFGSMESARDAWEVLGKVLPLEEVEEVIIHYNESCSSDAEPILQSVPQASRVVVNVAPRPNRR